MNCQHIKLKLQDYLDGDLSPKLRHEIADHLRTCASCQAEYLELARVGELARHEPLPIPPADAPYWDSAWQKIAQRIATQPQGIGMFERFWEILRAQFQIARLAYTAAVFCFGLILGGYLFQPKPIAPQQIVTVKPIEKTVIQYQEVPKLIEKPKYRVRYVILEPAKESVPLSPPATNGSAASVIAVATPTAEPAPDLLTRQQIEQMQKELQKSFDEFNVDKQIAQILGKS
ncbi:MAG: zf-HC2 domain-containing protein [bacterium]|nr:zf-HC2 domain-containing protein [bacterium]